MKYLMENEERKLLKTLRDSKSAVRDLVIVELVLNTGLRVQETRLLNVGDVFDGLTVRDHLQVRKETAKRCKAREIYLNRLIRKLLKRFLTFKREKGESLSPKAPLFISKKGNRMGQRTLQDMAEKWFKKARLLDVRGKPKYSFHGFRHTFAMKLRRRGVSLEKVQKLLGHASLQGTGIYLEPSKEDLIEALDGLAA